MKNMLPALQGTIFLCLLLANQSLFSQTTITINPGSNWTDAMLLTSEQPNRQYYASTNYGSHPRMGANAWTASGYPFFRRSLLRFNLSAIPSGAIISSATLYLYSDPTKSGAYDADGNSQLSGSNAIYFEKVTENWGETSVTWDNQPSSTATGRVWFPASGSTTENIQVDISSFVQSWVDNPGTNYGMKMKLENELHFRSRNYASEDHSNTGIRPKLMVTYSVDTSYQARVSYIFGALDQSRISTGILSDFGMDFADLGDFDGIIRDENHMSMTAWRTLYATLMTSSINPSTGLEHLSDLNDQINSLPQADANGTRLIHRRECMPGIKS